MRTASSVWKFVWPIALSLFAAITGLQAARAQSAITATVVQPIAAATFFNLYWDSTWDADNPGLSHESIDAATSAIITSSYLSSLSEYGVKSVAFGGSFLPNAKCVQKAPVSPGFFVAGGSGIAQFIQCEHDTESALQNPLVIYNVILPQSSLENDLSGHGFCSAGNSAAAWHYHGLPDFSAIPWYVPFSDGPVYTIVMSNPQCFTGAESGAFFENLTHEMVEALTDPFPIDISITPPHARVTFGGEIADICERGQTAPHAGPILAFANSASVTPNLVPVSVASHWSNAQQNCLGFSDQTMPSISNASTMLTNFGADMQLDITGSGFDPFASFTPLVTINDNTDGWQAGNVIDGNSIGIGNLTGVSQGEIKGQGLTNLGSFTVTQNNASLTVWVCNPSSLNCTSANVVTPPPPCPYGSSPAPSGGGCYVPVCTNGFVNSGAAGSCVCFPPKQVQAATGYCVEPSCPAGYHYDPATGSCLEPSCPSGYHYDVTQKKCVKLLQVPKP